MDGPFIDDFPINKLIPPFMVGIFHGYQMVYGDI
jgi:hypothetical protein